MSTIDFIDFRGMRPGRSPKLLGPSYSVIALNAYMETGAISPDYGPSEEYTLGKSGTINTLYLIKPGTWCHWTENVNVARMPIENNVNNRIAFTGTDKPRATDSIKATAGGGSNYPEVSYALGVPVPDNILDVTAVVSDPAGSLHVQWDIAGQIEDTTAGRLGRVYTYTYVTPWGEEGPPADPSHIVYANDDEEIHISNFAGQPSGDYQTMSVRIYRLLSGSAGDTEYLFVDEVALPVSEPYIDNVPDSSLGEALQTATWTAPPTGLRGITTMANGMMAGFIENDLYFCEPYHGHAWPEDYRRTVDFKIVGLASSGNMLFVMTEGYPYIAVGNHPTVISLNKMTRAPACVSAPSIVDMGSGAIYASNEGLCAISASGVQVVSREVMPERFWRQLNPSTMHGSFYKHRYVGFYVADADIYPPDSATGEPLPQYGMFQFDMAAMEVRFSSEWGPASYGDMMSADVFYTKQDAGTNKLYRWAGDSENPLDFVWRSGTKVTQILNVDSARVDARAYPVTFRLYVYGELKHTQTVTSREPFRLPSGYLARDWSVEIEGSTTVDGVFLATDIDDLT
ncbi:MAG: hypothetical protein KDC43_30065 [Saprospiraceae bacterium]|nr:hypothetical protein [Saprospiraceae bacterium]